MPNNDASPALLPEPPRDRRWLSLYALRLAAVAVGFATAAAAVANFAFARPLAETGLSIAVVAIATALAAFPVIRSLAGLHADLGAAEARLHRLEGCDPLTGLGNRTALLSDYEAGCSEPGAMMLIGVDRFRLVNSLFGHAAGDRVLVECARVIAEELGHLGRIYRSAGTEFVVLGKRLKVEEARAAAGALTARVATRDFGDADTPAHISVSIGIAAQPAGAAFERVFTDADRALISARETGRSSVRTALNVTGPCGLIEFDEIEWNGLEMGRETDQSARRARPTPLAC